MARQETPNQAVRRLRKERGLTLEEAAKQVGISAPVLCRIENGRRRITGDHAVKLAAWTGQPLSLFYPLPAGVLGA